MNFTLNNLTYTYDGNPEFVLGPLSLDIPAHHTTALIGSNGSGKTTLIKVLLNQFIKYEGQYNIDDHPARDYTGSFMQSYGIGYAPEIPVLDDRLSGNEILHILKDLHAIKDDLFTAEMAQFREYFHLDSWFETTPCGEYSQGMRKKVSLMIALIGAPPFIIIDEPTNGLDPIAVFGLKKILAHRKKSGCGALLSSHMLDFVERIADEVIILRKGTIASAGTVDDLLKGHPGKQLDEIYFDIFTRGEGKIRDE